MGKTNNGESNKKNENKPPSRDSRMEIRNLTISKKNEKKKRSRDDRMEINNLIIDEDNEKKNHSPHDRMDINNLIIDKNNGKKNHSPDNRMEIKMLSNGTDVSIANNRNDMPKVEKHVKADPKMDIGSLLNPDMNPDMNPDKEDTKITCPYCTQNVAEYKESEIHRLRMHIAYVHRDLGFFSCWRCIKSCTSGNDLLQHIRSTHPEENKSGFKLTYGRLCRLAKKQTKR